jgi:hypothetical protein
MHTRLLTVLAALASTAPLAAQVAAPAAPAPSATPHFDNTGVGDTSMFAPLVLPSANVYRSASGAPGPKYWQNHADYNIKASLDTTSKTLTGSLTLKYTNNSPDTLRFIWLQMEQNAFQDKSLNSYIFPEDSRFGARGFEGGDVVDRFDQLVGSRRGQASSERHGHEGRSR